MQFTALEPWQLMAFMAAGGVFSCVGLWLILRPKVDGHSMVLHVAGMKFEASSAGMLVFLIGTALFVTPLFVQERPAAAKGPGLVEGGSPDPTTPEQASTGRTSETPTGDIVLPRRVSGTEIEPNDGISDSMQMGFGETVEGSLTDGDEDWWVFTVPATGVEQFRVTFRNREDGCPQYHLYDGLENQVIRVQVCQSKGSETNLFWTDGGTYFVRVLAKGYRTKYQLLTSAVE